jgi:hypothetical protein
MNVSLLALRRRDIYVSSGCPHSSRPYIMTSSTTTFPSPTDFAPPHADSNASLQSDKTPFIICVILLGMMVTAAGAWAVRRGRGGRDLERLDDETPSGCISKTVEKVCRDLELR